MVPEIFYRTLFLEIQQKYKETKNIEHFYADVGRLQSKALLETTFIEIAREKRGRAYKIMTSSALTFQRVARELCP